MDLTDVVKARAEEIGPAEFRCDELIGAMAHALLHVLRHLQCTSQEPGWEGIKEKVDLALHHWRLAQDWENERSAMYQAPPEDADYADPFSDE